MAVGAALAQPIDRQVSFELPTAPLTPLQKSRTTKTENRSQGVFEGRLRMPDVDAKVPALVIVHTCHDRRWYDAWLQRFDDWGYATLSFSRCQPPDFVADDSAVPSLDWKRGSLASIGALEFLRQQPRIDSDKIGIMAWSRLGLIPLSIMNYEGFSQFFDAKFAVGIALYPFCSFARGPHGGPILIIAAEDDTWTDNTVCRRVVRESAEDRFPVKIMMLPDAVHGFDIPEFGHRRHVDRGTINPDKFAAGGGTIGYNEIAAELAVREVKAFLTQYLR